MDNMKVLDYLKSMSVDEFVDWLDEYGVFDNSPWLKFWDENYCGKCEPETYYMPNHDLESGYTWYTESDCAWCELHDYCKFFEGVDGIPNNKHMIELWLESEYE